MTRTLGKTGAKVGAVGLGGEGVLRTTGRAKEAVPVILEALKLGAFGGILAQPISNGARLTHQIGERIAKLLHPPLGIFKRHNGRGVPRTKLSKGGFTAVVVGVAFTCEPGAQFGA